MTNSCNNLDKFRNRCSNISGPGCSTKNENIPFRKIIIPAISSTDEPGQPYAPRNGAYANALVYYEATDTMYLYASDGSYTKIPNNEERSVYIGDDGDIEIDLREFSGKTYQEIETIINSKINQANNEEDVEENLGGSNNLEEIVTLKAPRVYKSAPKQQTKETDTYNSIVIHNEEDTNVKCDRPVKKCSVRSGCKTCKDTLFRKVVIPSSMGSDEPGQPYAPKNGAYRNTLVTYESTGVSYMYSSDGIYTKIAEIDVISPVNSVNGQTGDVVLDADDVNALPDDTLYGYSLMASGRDLSLKDQNGNILNTVQTQDTTYTAGPGISIVNKVISNTRTNVEWGHITGDITEQIDLGDTLSHKQDTLVSGTNIKTVNGQSIVGAGNINISGNVTSVNGKSGDVVLATSDLENDSDYITSGDIPPIPDKTSDLENDSGFITSSDIPTIPTKTSDLTNDSDFISSDSVDNKISEHNEDATAHPDIRNSISAIDEIIPAQASDENQLADKAFVNSTVQTGTANFRGNWNSWADVPTDSSLYPVDYAGSHIPTVNDYMVVQDVSDYTEETLEGTWRFKYSGVWADDGIDGWLPEYQVNETPMTAAQLAALNSGITDTKVTKLDGISSGAQVNVIESIEVNNVAQQISNKTVNITVPVQGSIASGNTGYTTGGQVYTAIGNIETLMATLYNGGGAQ